MSFWKLTRTPNHKKKYMIQYIEDGKVKRTIRFGANGYSDFLKHKDEDRKQRYIARHKQNEDWRNKFSSGFWSKALLWNRPTLGESIKDTEKKFGIDIKY